MDHQPNEHTLPLPKRILSEEIRKMLAHISSAQATEKKQGNTATLDTTGTSLKEVMLRCLHEQSRQLIGTAVKRSLLDPDDPDHYSAGDMDALNAIMLGFCKEVTAAIQGSADTDELCNRLQKVADNALRFDEEENISDAEESLFYSIFSSVLDAAIAHLDPDDKRLNVSATKGQRIVSLAGRSLATRHATTLDQIRQNYVDRFDQQAEAIGTHEAFLDNLDAATIAPAHFATRGVLSDDELRQCVNAAFKETYCVWRDTTNGRDDEEDEKEQIHIRNRNAYDTVSAQYAKEGDDSPEARFYDVCDGLIERDFFSPFRGPDIEFGSLWARSVNDALERRIAQNRTLRVVGSSADRSARLPHKAPQHARDVEGLLESCRYTREYLADSHEVLKACDAVVLAHYGDTDSPHAMQAQAVRDGVDLNDIDDGAYDAVCGRVAHVIDGYMQTHFYDRVNAMRLRNEKGPIHLEHDRDDEGDVISMPLHSTALVHQAYTLAEEAVPEKLQGTRLYAPALHKAQDFFLAKLAQEELWTCDFQSDYQDAKQSLMQAREEYRNGRAGRAV